MVIAIPSDINEQYAIAKILQDMNKEIQSLQQKKEKYTQIKQGMMQQLLTGKIRLI
jgi:type I restriction enzyme S subunit